MKQRLRPARAARPDEPGPHPARVHPGLHRGPGRRGPAGPHPGRPCRVRRRSRHPAHRGHRPRRGRRRHRAVECRRGGDARRARGHRLGGRRRPPDRRDRAQRGAVRAGTASASPGRSSTRSTSTRSRISPGPWNAGSPATASRCSASCRTGRSCRTRPWRWSSRASTARPSTPGRTSTRSSAASRSGRWSRSTCSSASGRESLVIVPGDRSRRHRGDRRGTPRTARTGGDGALGHRPVRRLSPGRAGPRRDPATPTCSRRSCREDTYQVASELHDLLVKTHPADAGKIAEIKALLWEYLFIDRVLEVAEEARFD